MFLNGVGWVLIKYLKYKLKDHYLTNEYVDGSNSQTESNRESDALQLSFLEFCDMIRASGVIEQMLHFIDYLIIL